MRCGWRLSCGSAACCCHVPQPAASSCLGRRCIVAAARQGWVCRSIVHESTMHTCKAGVSARPARQCCANAALLPACGPRAAGCWGCCCETRWLLARDCSVRPGGAHVKCQIVPAIAAPSALAGLLTLLKRFKRLPLKCGCPMKRWRRLGPVLAAESSGCSCCCMAGVGPGRSHCARWLRGWWYIAQKLAARRAARWKSTPGGAKPLLGAGVPTRMISSSVPKERRAASSTAAGTVRCPASAAGSLTS